MGINESHLHRNERIVLDLHPHWVMLFKAVLAVVVSTVIGIWLLFGLSGTSTFQDILGWIGILLIVASLGYFAQRWIAWYSTNFVVTTDRCIYRSGIIAKRGIEIPLERINTIFFEQGFLDRILRAGSLVIESAGEMGRQTFEDVRDPVHVQNVLYQEMEDNENRKFDRIGGSTQLSTADELAKLVDLHAQGHLSDAEFEQQKARLLES
ncbi:MAG: PH domain-containing protein [Microthrixaceae bacterium]|nr:PH domain-containing protein [Microthrixaceae bacterium]MCO5317311.1 PH domain-containing protein [Microthrixaceae bacterium]